MCSVDCDLHDFTTLRIVGSLYIHVMKFLLSLDLDDNINDIMKVPAVYVTVHMS
jgi:hypothetical protein